VGIGETAKGIIKMPNSREKEIPLFLVTADKIQPIENFR